MFNSIIRIKTTSRAKHYPLATGNLLNERGPRKNKSEERQRKEMRKNDRKWANRSKEKETRTIAANIFPL